MQAADGNLFLLVLMNYTSLCASYFGATEYFISYKVILGIPDLILCLNYNSE